MENNKPTKHILGSIEPKKMMAHPLSEKAKDKDYVVYECMNCDAEYLSQGIEDLEEDFCPNCEDKRFCEECCEIFDKKDGQMNNNDAWVCEDCFAYKCSQCDEEMDEDITYCSKQCHSEAMADLHEDEYKERNRR
jgi:DNA-directed RNA polymerase subunit RPC12/RpoP